MAVIEKIAEALDLIRRTLTELHILRSGDSEFQSYHRRKILTELSSLKPQFDIDGDPNHDYFSLLDIVEMSLAWCGTDPWKYGEISGLLWGVGIQVDTMIGQAVSYNPKEHRPEEGVSITPGEDVYITRSGLSEMGGRIIASPIVSLTLSTEENGPRVNSLTPLKSALIAIEGRSRESYDQRRQ